MIKWQHYESGGKKKYNDSLIYQPGVISKKNKNALFQGLALKRFEIIKSVESELF